MKSKLVKILQFAVLSVIVLAIILAVWVFLVVLLSI